MSSEATLPDANVWPARILTRHVHPTPARSKENS